MKVEIIRPVGFCYGVKRAFEIVKKAKNENPNKEIYVLGLLVHNEHILKTLEQDGIKTVYSIEDIPNEQVVVFSAHGHNEQLENLAKEKKLIIYDAICDKVKRSFETIKTVLKQNKDVIYIGVKGHKECESALSLGEKVHLYDINAGFKGEVDFKSPTVINQTSLNLLDLKRIHDEIKEKYNDAEFVDEICDVTRVRQNAVLKLDKTVDLLIVVGDKKSSNTTRLYELSKENNPERECVMVNSIDEIDIEMTKNKNHVMITSGTSTPDELVDAIYNYLINI